MKIYLDFDGTVVEFGYPSIGRFNPHAFEVLIALQESGHEIILNTARSEDNIGGLEAALEYMNEKWWMIYKGEKEFKPITSTHQKIHPHPWPFGKYPKDEDIWLWLEEGNKEELYIDDIATDIPLRRASMTEGNMVDWVTVGKHLYRAGIIKESLFIKIH